MYDSVHWCSIKNRLGDGLWVMGDRKSRSKSYKSITRFWYEISMILEVQSSGVTKKVQEFTVQEFTVQEF
jgi:hypothetical protein